MATKSATATTATAAQLDAEYLKQVEAENSELREQLAAANEELERLGLVELRTRVWINDRMTTETTRSNSFKLSFSGQKSKKLENGSRVYGQYHNFVAFGETAEALHALLTSGEQLLQIEAFESPWSNNAKRSDWVVKTFAPVERQQPAADGGSVTAKVPFSQEPSLEKQQF